MNEYKISLFFRNVPVQLKITVPFELSEQGIVAEVVQVNSANKFKKNEI